MSLLPVGHDALLLEVGSAGEAAEVFAAARRDAVEVVDVVPAAATVLFDGVRDGDALRRWLAGLRRDVGGAVTSRRVELPTRYDGPDLDDVARLWGMTRAEVVATHTAADLVVAFCGFSPGFAYCTGVGRSVPRLASPRARVPAGSVGLAGEFTGVYPSASPGGWRLVGRTAATLWDPSADPPALLSPGTTVRFVEVAP